jgi:hypothetical protein
MSFLLVRASIPVTVTPFPDLRLIELLLCLKLNRVVYAEPSQECCAGARDPHPLRLLEHRQ